MAEDPDPTLIGEIEDIRDDIVFRRGLIASLKEMGADEAENDIQEHEAQIRSQEKRLRALQPPSQTNNNPSASRGMQRMTPATERPGSSHSWTSEGSMPHRGQTHISRKRQRGDFGYDEDANESSYKSRRTTPSSVLTAAASPADSNASLDSLPEFNSLFSSTEEATRAREFWTQHEERKRQEEADAELARTLSQQWSQDDTGGSTQESSFARPSEYTQRFLTTDGTINRRPATSSVDNGESSSSSINHASTPMSRPQAASNPTQSEPLTATFRKPIKDGSTPAIPNRFRPQASPHLDSSIMPGSFPGPQPLLSTGGASVYDLTSYNSPTSALGSSTRPYDLTQPYGGSSSLQPFHPLGASSMADPYAHLRDQFTDPTKTKEEIEELLKQIRPDEEFSSKEVSEQPRALSATMMPHQMYGLTWMQKMEEGTNKGGILADDMGLGKTIQSIALILSRPPAETQHRPTLVVAPVALMHQWKRELEKMVKPRHHLNVFVLHGQTRTTTWSALRAYDVVLTTYGLLASELKRKLDWEEKVKRVPDTREECPVLGERSHFHRVILDEAQNIKNHRAKAAFAACRIKADHRWALSGTPMQNNVEEMFSLVKFCRIRPYCEWERFRKDISGPLKSRWGDGKDKGMRTLQALLRAILLRRTKQSKIDGQPILQLPDKNTTEDRVAFNEDELTFYKALETKAQIQINKYIQKGSMGQNYSHALVLLLRLRQACCHPHLVTQSKDFIQAAGNLDTNDLITNAVQLDQKVVQRLKEVDCFECPICMDVDENPALFPCGHTLCSDCLSRLVDQATNDTEGRPKCPHCRAQIDANKITDVVSFHRVHCPDREGVEPLEQDNVGSDSDSETDFEADDDDSDEGDDLSGFIVPDDFEESSASVSRGKKPAKQATRKKRSKPKDTMKSRDAFKSLAQLRKEGLHNKHAKRKYLRRLRKNFVTSAKIERTIQLLEEIKSRGENEKTIIFSTFTSFLDLLEVPLSDHKGFRHYVRYDGSMSSVDRNNAVLEFTDNVNCTVILVSLKAGNSGLNLTAANHVVMLDPFWNPFVEYQAADRCYRIGQKREVTVHRVLIGESDEAQPAAPAPEPDPESSSKGFTVEDRILALQERKRRLVETALDETAGRDVARLGVRELGYLFGLNQL
ncbi:hypothetical protein LTR72_002158 [Exophiala xenobiotica]|nr:hypothetical protein LTR72_002158 [Exophiala xenobiotica]KAK5302288.1 hypothetical protein LTR14_000537 [Exophiala xenobiotica]KAK5487334.1 hypothetical protein LTR55_004705 [Exophiala xenobiotica]